MDVSQPFVDLFSAETATFLAWADYFVGDKLDAVSPQIRKRIYYETNNRIFSAPDEQTPWLDGGKRQWRGHPITGTHGSVQTG